MSGATDSIGYTFDPATDAPSHLCTPGAGNEVVPPSSSVMGTGAVELRCGAAELGRWPPGSTGDDVGVGSDSREPCRPHSTVGTGRGRPRATYATWDGTASASIGSM